MVRVILHVAILGGIAFAAAPIAHASDIGCETSFRSNAAQCGQTAWSNPECSAKESARHKAAHLICEYAMLSNSYESIYDEQQRLLSQGKISDSDITAWRAKRDSCDSVTCLDGVFAEWKQRAERLNAPVAVSPGVSPPQTRAFGTGTALTRSIEPSFAGVSLTPIEARPAEPPAPQHQGPSQEASNSGFASSPEPAPAAAAAKKASNPLAGLIWIGIIGVGLARLLMPKRDRRFKTGFKNNRTIPTAVPILYGLSAVAILVGFIAS
ncbi:hypothetical protein [Cupriavidus sp. AcVe19-6a]|uniref:hypothetical protein n=1 Tax=Cupriavidus sp. AcVe19-6a TaxID=2821358 RepID=UPI001AE55E7F|nr:hypothetical protein [Cupriavidus sp. AcVe19-6a]MBP0639129.1 hypothetical protein [Cupriavidus sp. AcVe19-6a]